MNEGTANPELLTHTSGQIFGGSVAEGGKAGAGKELRDALVALGATLAEQPPEKLDVLVNAQVRIKISTEALRHKSDAWADASAMRSATHIAPKDQHPAALNVLCTGEDAEQRRLADCVGADNSYQRSGLDIGRYVIEGDDGAVAVS